MSKRLLLLLPLVVTLAACDSSPAPENNAPTPTVAATTAPGTTETTVKSDSARADSPQAAATSAPATSTSTASAASAGDKPADAAVETARKKAAQNFHDTGKWVAGKNYQRIQPTQPKATDTSRVEVVEVFSYGCPACNRAHKFMDKLEDDLPAYATMAYLPAGFRPDENWPLYQRAWYTAKALGIAHKTHDAMFDATWNSGETATYNLDTGRPKDKSNWPDISDIAQFYSQYGVSADKFENVADSFAVNTKIKRANKLIKDYGVAGTPTIVVDGKYRFSIRDAGGYSQAIELAEWLAAKEAAGK